MEFKENIDGLLAEFKEGRFIYGESCMGEVGDAVAAYGTTCHAGQESVSRESNLSWSSLKTSLKLRGVELINERVDIIRPNAPEEDMYRLAEVLGEGTARGGDQHGRRQYH